MAAADESVGTLECTLKHAQDLKDVDFLDGGKHPTWNETFIFPNVNPKTMALKIEFFDENVVFRDVTIGSAQTALVGVAANGAQDVELPVTRKGKRRGIVFVGLKFKLGKTAVVQHAGSMPPPEAVPKTASKTENWILPTYAGTDAWKEYEPGTILGKGTFGTTYLATHKKSQEKVAVKVIGKKKLTTPEEIGDVQREVQIMHHLNGHPNVVALRGVYEDKANVCIAMDVCNGGELFDAIVKKGHYTERDAAQLIRTIVGVVAHCHNMGVIHRDLKPENFLLSDKTSQAQLKATDFGLSSFFQEGQIFTDIVGSAYYVAPEVLRRSYSKECDIWSCGVMLYILLCGYPPFHGDNEKKIFEAVVSKPLDFSSDPWPKISEPAKECVRKMLVRDPKRRATAITILQHEWMRENGVASDQVIEIEVLSRIKKFSAMNRLKKEALKVIAKNLPVDEISGMREIFLDIDKDKSGTITLVEFTQALRKKGSVLPESEVDRIMQAADVNGDGTIDYEEFLAATINMGKVERDEHLRTAFQHFDLDGNGFITRDELTTALSNLGISNVDQIIAEVDKDGSGDIDYKEFCAMMRNL